MVAAAPGRRILNSADPDAPNALEISRTVARQLDHPWDEILLDGANESLGRHPWDPSHPIVLDMGAALDLGYTPVGDYASTVAAEVDWLVATARSATGSELFPGFDDAFFQRFFDYAAEDGYLTTHPG